MHIGLASRVGLVKIEGYKAPSPMFPAALAILRSASLRRFTLMLFLCGVTGAATLPYLPILGVRELGLADATLSLLIFIFSVAGLVAGVGMAVFSDLVRDRRALLAITALAGVVGTARRVRRRTGPRADTGRGRRSPDGPAAPEHQARPER